jgi:hypothetical protein
MADGLRIITQADSQDRHFTVVVDGEAIGCIRRVEGGFRLDNHDGLFGDFAVAVLQAGSSLTSRLRTRADRITDALMKALLDGVIEEPPKVTK